MSWLPSTSTASFTPPEFKKPVSAVRPLGRRTTQRRGSAPHRCDADPGVLSDDPQAILNSQAIQNSRTTLGYSLIH